MRRTSPSHARGTPCRSQVSFQADSYCIRRTDAKGSTQKTIEAVGHTSKVSLTMRNDAGKESAKSAVPKGKEPATKRGVQRKPKHVEADFITSQVCRLYLSLVYI